VGICSRTLKLSTFLEDKKGSCENNLCVCSYPYSVSNSGCTMYPIPSLLNSIQCDNVLEASLQLYCQVGFLSEA
jgi:hypothetical protein